MKKKTTKVLIAGSFDPITNGHLWMINEARELFDEVVVAIAVNPEKKSLFTLSDRLNMIRASVADDVIVDSFEEEYTVDYARSINAEIFVRGIRNTIDYEYEKTLQFINNKIDPEIRTVFLSAPENLAIVSSSMVKTLVGPCGWERHVAGFVPVAVLKQFIISKHDLYKNLITLGGSMDEKLFWEKVLDPYFEPHRHYHIWQHICDMLAEFRKIKHLLKDPVAVEAAIWLHDIVYDVMVKRRINEEESAQYAENLLLEMKLSPEFADKVFTMIIATKHDRKVTDSDTQYLVDIDLTILGARKKIFDEYDENIRREYSWVDDETFHRRRAVILGNFLKGSIYYTDHFKNKYQKTARENLMRSIDRLNRS